MSGVSSVAGLPLVISQVTFPGVGDIDDCWIIAAYTGATYSQPGVKLPTIYAFRQAAGVPETARGNDGGDIDEAFSGIGRFFPDVAVRRVAGQTWAATVALLDAGYVLSLCLLASALPASLQYGFAGPHQVLLAKVGSVFYLGNPLAAMGSRMQVVRESNVKTAALAFGGGGVFAIAFPPPEGDVMLIADQVPAPMWVDLALQTQCYAGDGKTPVVKIQSGGAGVFSPFTVSATQRAVSISVGGQRQVLVVLTKDCKNIRPALPVVAGDVSAPRLAAAQALARQILSV